MRLLVYALSCIGHGPDFAFEEYLNMALEILERLGTLIEPEKVKKELAELPTDQLLYLHQIFILYFFILRYSVVLDIPSNVADLLIL